MCEIKPGVRCAADTRTASDDAHSNYREANPDGPDVDALSSATQQCQREALRIERDAKQAAFFDAMSERDDAHRKYDAATTSENISVEVTPEELALVEASKKARASEREMNNANADMLLADQPAMFANAQALREAPPGDPVLDLVRARSLRDDLHLASQRTRDLEGEDAAYGIAQHKKVLDVHIEALSQRLSAANETAAPSRG